MKMVEECSADYNEPLFDRKEIVRDDVSLFPPEFYPANGQIERYLLFNNIFFQCQSLFTLKGN